MKMSGNTILITGGGTGIGRALAERFHASGNTVIIAGRRRAVLDEVTAANEGVVSFPLDMADVASIESLAMAVIADYPRLNVVLNVAGILPAEGPISSRRDLRAAEDMIATNLLGTIRLVDAFVDQLSGQEDAALMTVTSGLAFVPLATTATYNATKAAVHFYTEALRVQLAGKVEVIELIPPGVQTELTPGQSTLDRHQPLAEFTDEVMGLLATSPTPHEITVERVKFLRYAEREGRYSNALSVLNQSYRK
jgi:uncharacterized oxidoreductase